LNFLNWCALCTFFADVFSAEVFIEFERYISGLIVSKNKTVEGFNRLFVSESRNQSSLNRLLTQSRFDLEELNKARMNVLTSWPETQLKQDGALSWTLSNCRLTRNRVG